MKRLQRGLWSHLRVQQAHRKIVRQLATLQRMHRRTETVDQNVAVDLACPSCFGPMPTPALLWPCGHTFCAGCAADMVAREVCEICDSSVERQVPNQIAAAICRTFLSRQTLLTQTHELLQTYGSTLDLIAAEESLVGRAGGARGMGSVARLI